VGDQGKLTNIVEVTSADIEEEGEDEEGIVKVRDDSGKELTEDDVERAIEEGMSPGERLFAEVATNIAKEVGIFGETSDSRNETSGHSDNRGHGTLCKLGGRNSKHNPE
jgi:hypothetical protein